MKIVTQTTTRKHHSLELTDKQIREALKLPKEARISFRVPTGGDYSGDELDISDYPLRVHWETFDTKTSEEER